MDSMTGSVLASVTASFWLAAALAMTAGTHGRYTMDLPVGVQKMHIAATPRVGGLAVYLALWIAAAILPQAPAGVLRAVLLAGTPALLVGLLEDVTKRVSPAVRLQVIAAGAAVAVWSTGSVISRLDVAPIDPALQLPAVAALFTIFAVTGLTNAINIIDGFHGLASGTSALCLLAFAGIASAAGDWTLALVALTIAASLAGFWLVNFPWGKLFLGDGGAYFAGFALAWIAVLLPMRNPHVSPWASLLVCAYPVIEVLYSMARRWCRGQAMGCADRDHLHSLVAMRVVQRRLRGLDPTLQNAAVSVLMWACAAIPALAGLALYAHTTYLQLAAAAALLFYHWLYRLVARP